MTKKSPDCLIAAKKICAKYRIWHAPAEPVRFGGYETTPGDGWTVDKEIPADDAMVVVEDLAALIHQTVCVPSHEEPQRG